MDVEAVGGHWIPAASGSREGAARQPALLRDRAWGTVQTTLRRGRPRRLGAIPLSASVSWVRVS